MKKSENGKNLIKSFEALSSTVKGKNVPTQNFNFGGDIFPYIDDVGVCTIGFGSTYFPDGSEVTMDCDPINAKKASEIFDACLESFENFVNDSVKNHLTQNQFDACVCFCYNVGKDAFGSSSLLKKININTHDLSIAGEFGKWCHGTVDGKMIELAGLKNRRQKESDLYFKDVL